MSRRTPPKYPRKYRAYWPSSLTYPASENFRGYGSDGSEARGDVLYIGHDISERMVALKAFIDSIKINLDKDGTFTEGKDKNHKIFKPYNGKMSYNVSLNIPAHTVNESRNNLSKIAELQRYIVPGQEMDLSKLGVKISAEDKEKKHYTKNLFSVFFKNLINSGRDYGALPRIRSYKDLFDYGFPCYLESINYEPDLEMGFFVWKSFKFPKNIKLNLTLNLETDIHKNFGSDGFPLKTIKSFIVNGMYHPEDSQLFPFLVSVKTANVKEMNRLPRIDYTTSEMNDLKYMNSKQDSYIFISLLTDKDDVAFPKTRGCDFFDPKVTRRRYVFFKPFLESFSREVKVDANISVSKHLDLDQAFQYSTYNGIDYKFKFNISADDIEEAKKNCGKIQYLMRMFFKKNNDDDKYPGEINKKPYLSVYIPHMIEKAKANRAPQFNFASALDNSVTMIPDTMSFEISSELGFFEENDKLYPKVMSIEMSFVLEDVRSLNPFRKFKSGHENFYSIDYDPYPEEQSFLDNINDENPILFPLNIKYANVTKT